MTPNQAHDDEVKKVELRCAYEWTCDACGQDNFCRAVTTELTEEDRQAMAEKYPDTDPEEWRTGNWMTRPDEVTCSHCGVEFETEEVEGPTK